VVGWDDSFFSLFLLREDLVLVMMEALPSLPGVDKTFLPSYVVFLGSL